QVMVRRPWCVGTHVFFAGRGGPTLRPGVGRMLRGGTRGQKHDAAVITHPSASRRTQDASDDPEGHLVRQHSSLLAGRSSLFAAAMGVCVVATVARAQDPGAGTSAQANMPAQTFSLFGQAETPPLPAQAAESTQEIRRP